MLCNNCKITPLCKIFDVIKTLPPDFIVISNCQVCNKNNTAVQQAAVIKNYAAVTEKLKEIGQKENTAKECICEICDSPTREQTCSSCGITICDGCLITDVNSLEIYCEQCWNER